MSRIPLDAKGDQPVKSLDMEKHCEFDERLNLGLSKLAAMLDNERCWNPTNYYSIFKYFTVKKFGGLSKKQKKLLISDINRISPTRKPVLFRIIKLKLLEVHPDIISVLKPDICSLVTNWKLGIETKGDFSNPFLNALFYFDSSPKSSKHSKVYRDYLNFFMINVSADLLFYLIKNVASQKGGTPNIFSSPFIKYRKTLIPRLLASYTESFEIPKQHVMRCCLQVFIRLSDKEKKMMLRSSSQMTYDLYLAATHYISTCQKSFATEGEPFSKNIKDLNIPVVLSELEAWFILDVINCAPIRFNRRELRRVLCTEVANYLVKARDSDTLIGLMLSDSLLCIEIIRNEIQVTAASESNLPLFERYSHVVAEQNGLSKRTVCLDMLDKLHEPNHTLSDKGIATAKNFAWYLQLNADEYSDDPGFQVEVFRRSIQYFSDPINPKEIINPSVELTQLIIEMLGQKDLPPSESQGSLARALSSYNAVLFNAVCEALRLSVCAIPDHVRLKAAERLVCLCPGIEDMPGVLAHEKIFALAGDASIPHLVLAVSFSDALDALFAPIKVAIEKVSPNSSQLLPQLMLMQENFNNPKDGKIEAKLTAFVKTYEKLKERGHIDAKSSSYLKKLMPLLSLMLEIMQYKSPSFSQSAGLFSLGGSNPLYEKSAQLMHLGH